MISAGVTTLLTSAAKIKKGLTALSYSENDSRLTCEPLLLRDGLLGCHQSLQSAQV
jgi:hypothetical protein